MMERALVTGGGTGIGRGVAELLAEDGYSVSIVGRRPAPLEETLDRLTGGPHSRISADVSTITGVQKVAAAVSDRGRLDALVHCAGGLGDSDGDDLSTLYEQMLDSFRTNVVSVAMLTEALAPMLRDGRGRVAAIGSIAAFRGGGIAYASSKSALHGWAFTAARAFGRRGVTVNVVAPGYIADTELFGDGPTDARRRRLVDETMVGKAGLPADVAAMTAFLVSAGAGHVTAQVIGVNGGALPR